MGMFDTFVVNGRDYQTKDLECTLDAFALGDTVGNLGKMPSYFLEPYTFNQELKEMEYVGVIVIDNIYIASCAAENVRTTFDTYYKNPDIVAKTLANIIKERLNPDRYEKNNKLSHIYRIVEQYKQFISDEPNIQLQRFYHYEYIERLQNGEQLHDMLTEIFKGKEDDS